MNKKLTLKQKIGGKVIALFPGTKENFNILRFEINAWALRMKNRTLPNKIKNIKKVISGNNLSVNFGAGPFGEEGWINIDMFRMKNISFTYDCRRKVPLKDNTVARIRCEHMLEHLDRKEETPIFLKECYRCMIRGAVLRIIVPDVSLYIKACYLQTEEAWADIGIPKESMNENWQPMDIMNHVFRQDGEHKFGYDYNTLSKTLRETGFQKITQMSYQHSHDPLLKNDQEVHRYYSLYVECIK